MKFILVELHYNLNNLKQITFNTIRRIKNKYYKDTLFKLNYNNEDLKEILIKLIKDVSLEKTPILINYCLDTVVFLNISLPKMNKYELFKNIDFEIDYLVNNYKERFDYVVERISVNKQNDFRVTLQNKIDNKLLINDYLKDVKIKRIKSIYNYQIAESVISTYKYKSNTNYIVLYLYEEYLLFNLLNNGKVIEIFKVEIEKDLLREYTKSYNYQDLININNQYFKTLAKFINEFSKSRSVEGVILLYSDYYNEYLQNLISKELNVAHYTKNTLESTSSALEELLYEK